MLKKLALALLVACAATPALACTTIISSAGVTYDGCGGPNLTNTALRVSDGSGVGTMVPDKPGAPFEVHGVFATGGNIGSRGNWYGALNTSQQPEGTGGNNPGQIEARLYCRGNSDCGVFGWNRSGTETPGPTYDPSGIYYPTYTRKCRQLVKLAGGGYASNGFAQNESGRVDVISQQGFGNGGEAPNFENTSAGASVTVKVTSLNTNSPFSALSVDPTGAVVLGETAPGDCGDLYGLALAAQGGKGWLFLPAAPQPPGTPFPAGKAQIQAYDTGGGVIRLLVRYPDHGGSQFMVVQEGPATPGCKACWNSNGMLTSCC